MSIETANKFMVSSQGDGLVIMAWGKKLSHADAQNLAAWLAAMASTEHEFTDVLQAVQST